MQKQAQQNAQQDYHAKYREFQIGQKVMVRSMRPGPTWIPGEVIQKLGLVTYVFGGSDGRTTLEVSCGPIEGACRRIYTHSGTKHS